MITHWILTVCLAIQFLAPLAQAKPTKFSADRRAELALLATQSVLGSFENLGKLVDSFPRATDREYFRKTAAAFLKQPLRAQFVSPLGLTMRIGSEEISILAKDLSRLRFRVMAKDFTLNPRESAEEAVQRLQRLTTANVNLFLPKAEAIGLVAVAVGVATLTVAAGIACTVMDVSDPLTCAAFAPLAIPAAAVAGGTLILASLGLIDPSGRAVYFDVTDIECAPSLERPLRATILEERKKPSVVEVYYKESGAPDRLEIKVEGEAAKKVFLTEEFSLDETRNPEFAKDASALEAARLQAKASKNLMRACEGNDSKEALALHLKWKSVPPQIIPSVTPAKAVR